MSGVLICLHLCWSKRFLWQKQHHCCAVTRSEHHYIQFSIWIMINYVELLSAGLVNNDQILNQVRISQGSKIINLALYFQYLEWCVMCDVYSNTTVVSWLLLTYYSISTWWITWLSWLLEYTQEYSNTSCIVETCHTLVVSIFIKTIYIHNMNEYLYSESSFHTPKYPPNCENKHGFSKNIIPLCF